MVNEKAQLRETIKKTESNLYKLSKQFEETEKLNSNLKETYDSILLMEKITEENPVLTAIATKEIKEKKLVSLFKQMEEKLALTKQKINSFDDNSTRAKLFLENFRTTRIYEFNDSESMENFVKQSYPLFSISRVLFKPEFVGTIKLESIAEELNEKAQGNQMISISTEKLPKLMEIIEKKDLFKNARIENELLKTVIKGQTTILVDSDNARIRRLDRLCKQFDGKWKEE